MKPHLSSGGCFTCVYNPPPLGATVARIPGFHRRSLASEIRLLRRIYGGEQRCASKSVRLCRNTSNSNDEVASRRGSTTRRRDVLVMPLFVLGASYLKSYVARADEKLEESGAPPPTTVDGGATPPTPVEDQTLKATPVEQTEEVIGSRIYDATVIGEPLALGKDKKKVWEKLMNARVVYLGEAEQVPIPDDKEVELEVLKNLRKRCLEAERPISLALESFPCTLQEQLDQFMDSRIDGETLKSLLSHWPPEHWEECEPILNYCRDNGVKIIACGTPLEILRTVQAEGISGLSKSDRKTYTPPAGSGFISGFPSVIRRSSIDLYSSSQSSTFGPSSYLSVQSKVVEDYTMSQILLKAMADGAASGMLVVVTGASHVIYGTRGTGLPARISKKISKKNQIVILLDPERQYLRREGEVPVADFLWYSAARPCSRNCFDRAEIARVMNAAGRKRDALPQDIQKGLDLGVVSPEVLQNFFDLEQNPIISELTNHFQGFRERLLADPKFLQRLAIEESISITTTLLAQYERRKENFFDELDYVITDTLRGSVVDFFTVWLPAPTLSFLSFSDETASPDTMDALKGLLGSIPDNAFQKDMAGRYWDLNQRIASVIIGGLKLACVGFISSIGAVASSNILYATRRLIYPSTATKQKNKRSPILKTAFVYSCFLGTSANLRYQVIAGIVEHRVSDLLVSQPLLVNALSFVVRTVNSYWGTQQWIDLARLTGLQTRKVETPVVQDPELPSHSSEEGVIDDVKNQ